MPWPSGRRRTQARRPEQQYSSSPLSAAIIGGIATIQGRRQQAVPERKYDRYFVNFSPAVSDEAGKAMRREIRHWRLQRRSDKTLGDLARMFNRIVQGWINYFGRYYPSMLHPTLRPLNDYLVRWAQRKYKRLRGHAGRARRFLADVARREPNLFAHWRFGLRPLAG